MGSVPSPQPRGTRPPGWSRTQPQRRRQRRSIGRDTESAIGRGPPNRPPRSCARPDRFVERFLVAVRRPDFSLFALGSSVGPLAILHGTVDRTQGSTRLVVG